MAASILTAIYHMLKIGTEYQDLGANYLDRRSPQIVAKRLIAQLANLGINVQIIPQAEAA